MIKITLIIILAISGLGLASLLTIITFVTWRQKTTTQLMKKAHELVNLQSEQQVNITMKRIGAIAERNNQFVSLMHDLNIVHKDFVNNFTHLREAFIAFKKIAQPGRVKLKMLKQQFVKLANQNEQLEQIKTRFDDLSKQFLTQDEKVRNEFTFYQSCMRQATKLYDHKKVLLDYIAPDIELLKIKLQKLSSQFENAIHQANLNKATIYKHQYITQVKSFIDVVNSGPALCVQLKHQIPSQVATLVKKHQQHLQTNQTLATIDFQKTIKKIAKDFAAAKKYCHQLQIKLAIQKTKQVLKALAVIETHLDHERTNQTIFTLLHPKINDQLQLVQQQWTDLAAKIKTIYQTGQLISADLHEQYQLAQGAVAELQTRQQTFTNICQDQKQSYGVKIVHGQQLIQKATQATHRINQLILQIWTINLHQSLASQSFAQADLAFNQLRAAVNRHKLKLTTSEQTALTTLDLKRREIAKMIKTTPDQKVQAEVETFANSIADCYAVIDGKMQIATYLQNLLGEFATRRSLDQKIDLHFNLAEKKYVEGAYTEGLNLIIDTIAERIGHA